MLWHWHRIVKAHNDVEAFVQLTRPELRDAAASAAGKIYWPKFTASAWHEAEPRSIGGKECEAAGDKSGCWPGDRTTHRAGTDHRPTDHRPSRSASMRLIGLPTAHTRTHAVLHPRASHTARPGLRLGLSCMPVLFHWTSSSPDSRLSPTQSAASFPDITCGPPWTWC